MNYVKLIKIENVVGFCSKKGNYAYTKGEKSYLFIDGILLEKDDTPSEFSFRDKYMYVWYNSGKFELYNGYNLLKSIENNTNLLNEQTQYVGKHFMDMNTFQTYYNFMFPIDEHSILSQYVPYKLYVENNVIIAHNNFKGEFKRINTNTETLWQFPLLSLGGSEYEPNETDKINKILGIAHGNLWFHTYFNRLVALDLETGNKVYSLDCFNVYLDDKTKNIFSIGSNIIIIIDTKTLTISEQYNFLQADPTGIGAYRSVFSPLLQGEYFTFLGEKEKEYGGIGWVGIFDYKARKLIWEYEVISQEERNATRNQLVISQPLYMSGNKLYIKDIKDNLHIFEREDV